MTGEGDRAGGRLHERRLGGNCSRARRTPPLRLLWTVLAGLSTVLAGAPIPLGADDPWVEAWTTVGTPGEAWIRGRAFEGDRSGWIPGPGPGQSVFAANLSGFLADDLEEAPVEVSVAGRTIQVVTDDDGLYQAKLAFDPPLELGSHPVSVRAEGEAGPLEVEGLLLTVAAEPGLTVVSDFDDTLVVSDVLDRLALLGHVFFEPPEDLEAVPAMNAFLRCLRVGPDGLGAERTGIHYLSASPENLRTKIRSFLEMRRFPNGELHLRGGGEIEDYKVESLLAIARRFPGHRMVLVGDGGQHDPEAYQTVRERLGDRVAAVFIRRVPGMDPDPTRFEDIVLFDDGVEAARAAADRGLLHPSCAELLEERREAHHERAPEARREGPPEARREDPLEARREGPPEARRKGPPEAR